MKIVECSICNGKAELVYENRIHKFRGEDFSINEHFYKCVDCEEEFTTTEIDQLNIVQVYNQHRERHHIPFPEKIKATRDKYGLSAAKMSEVLGFGINSYRNYENGEIPTAANAKLILLAENPAVFKEIVEGNGTTLKPKEFEHLIKIIDSLIEKSKEFMLLEFINFQNNVPNEYTGFKEPSIEKIKNLVLFFLKHIKKDFADKVKLNKLFFYSDFLHYKRHGYSITGFEYRAIPFGPAPSNYDVIYSNLQQTAVIESKFEKAVNGSPIELFEPATKWDNEVFNEKEMQTISEITEKFKDIPSWDLVNISHNEKAWIELNQLREIISYQKYSFQLTEV